MFIVRYAFTTSDDGSTTYRTAKRAKIKWYDANVSDAQNMIDRTVHILGIERLAEPYHEVKTFLIQRSQTNRIRRYTSYASDGLGKTHQWLQTMRSEGLNLTHWTTTTVHIGWSRQFHLRRCRNNPTEWGRVFKPWLQDPAGRVTGASKTKRVNTTLENQIWEDINRW